MFTPKLYDAIILGGGPAGLSAALALARVRRSVLVLSHNEFRNGGVTAMHNVLSRDGIHPDDFRKISREQIEAYGPGIQFIEGEAMRLRQKMVKDGYSGFEVEDEKSRIWKSKKLILAMGSRDIFPDVEGYKDNWPENIYQCLFCDGIERSHLPIGIFGALPGTLLHLAMMAINLTGDPSKVTIFQEKNRHQDPKNLEAVNALTMHGCGVEERTALRMSRVNGLEVGINVTFTDGGSRRFGFLLDKPPTEPVGLEMVVGGLGVETTENMFGTDLKSNEPFGESNVKGVFVAGDAGSAKKAVPMAYGSGCLAGAGVASQLSTEEGEAVIARFKDTNVRNLAVGVEDATGCSS